MALTRAERVAALFDQALDVSASARPAFLQAACGDDGELYRELSSLLAAHASADAFFDSLAEDVIAPASAAVVARGRADVPAELASSLEGRYRIERELGGGSLSRVFLAEELGLERQVVIKMLPPELAATVSGERFRREIQLAAQLQHPHIVPLLSADAGGHLLYYIMPYVAGESLRMRLRRDGAIPVADASRIWRDLLDALAYAHAHGVVHRDVKPGNVLLSGRNALIADFGIARALEAAGEADVTAPGHAIGTPAYMAPEQIDGGPSADHRVDLYASALVMYEMLEGRLPFSGDSPGAVARARLADEPAPITRAECPPALAAIVLHCLAREPGSRPASAEAVLGQLDSLAGGLAAGRGRSPRRRLITIGFGAVLLSGAALGARYLERGRGAAPAGVTSAPSLAVLPLANLSPEPGDAALADGMTEELIAVLSQGGTLRVVASTSVRALQDRQLEVRQIAESLRVSHVLEGAFQKIGSKVRMQLRLVDARDGSTRWSETYDRAIGDIFAMQDDIARAVANELGVRMALTGTVAGTHQRPTPSVAAYELYLRGKENALLRSSAGRRQGIDYLQRAIALDSNFAAAHAALVWIYLNETGTSPGDHLVLARRAEAEALKAIALDDTLADAYSALGWTRLPLDLPAAEIAFKRAVGIDPAAHRGYEGLARFYMLARRPAEQLAAAERGLAIDPYSVAANREMALALSTNGRCDEALALLRPLKDLKPPAAVAGVIRGQCYASKQMWPEAIAELRWAMETTEARAALGLLGYVLGRSGQRAEAQAILSDLLAGRKQSHGAFGIALVYAGLRDYDHAFAWLEKAVQEGSVRVYIMDPLFADLQRDPRFDRLFPQGGVS
ncbi:MAG TPA: protein kinase [Gemmatimonadales bacterium]|jgi:serine/threonine-protein kinase|nr:protein kinase [Gemmatimonadales bacterium]